MMRVLETVTTVGSLVGAFGAFSRPALSQQGATGMPAEQVIAAWKATPKEVAQKMLAKYGKPNEVTANRLVWHNNGPWKKTELVNEEIAHDFPVPHKDMLYQSIAYRVDAGKADEILQYDGSVVLERTKGELAG